ncbi:type II toxin-antitoxin system RelE/ParE family toxin [Caulobacter sp. BK020]|uniref:type II toxin-antitoxin system RelE/ParE family toxin n=1 Tax=Caulobacter sp. BK020 TaxID=2512117 RepID=UPI00104A8EDF|nr:type II toxin-antitoxin system RelE/ParE family toxin [Caulobacter sp. BK020]TCS10230.1 plasmid stabilization system protein ParE [Caulobacter sp. BK020]
MRRIVWTDEARANLQAIRNYIAQFSPLAAQRFSMRLVTAAEDLAENPDRGRSVGNGRRELALIRPYLIRYRVETEAVFILRIRHAARKPD